MSLSYPTSAYTVSGACAGRPGPWDDLVEFEPWLEFDNWGDRWLSTPTGEPIAVQVVQPEAQQGVNRIVFPASVLPGEAVQVLVRDDSPSTRQSLARASMPLWLMT